MKSRHIVIPIFVPHKGCPFDCIYCNQKTISGQVDEMTGEKMQKIIEENISTISKHDHVGIGFYGGSFTGIEKDQQIEFLEIANKYIKAGIATEIRLSTRPDYINAEILEYLKKYNVATIELGVQSLDQEVLNSSCRGHSVEDVFDASYMIKDFDIKLGIQTMIGLPGDSMKSDLYTAKTVIGLNPDIVRIYPTLVIKGTYLEKMYNEGAYMPLSLEEASAICARLLDLYDENQIKVIRVGLQPTENINNNMDVVAGPFHPAFRQLVESKRVLNIIEKQIEEKKLNSQNEIVIYAAKRDISDVIGQKRANIDYLNRKYGFRRVIVEEDSSPGAKISVK